MAVIRYAFRDDPLNVYMLTEGATESRKYTQILGFRKREVATSFLDDLFYLDTKAPTPGYLTPIGTATQQKNWCNPLTYVAKIDSQAEFAVSRGVFEKLVDTFYPAWRPNAPLSYYGDQPSGFIVFLRVYRVQDKLDERLLIKGRQGSSQIIQLYNEQGITSVETEILEPVLSDNRFDYIKDEILYILKKENAFIALFQNNAEGRKLLQTQVDATRAIAQKQRLRDRFDPSAEIDMAQVDYEAIFREITEIAPTMRNFVNYIANIKPAQIGEIDHLMPLAKSGESSARQRIIEMNMRGALRYALWVYRHYDVDLEDSVQECMIGIVTALEKYPIESDTKFATYAGMWMRQTVFRYLPIGEYVARLPVHYMERILPLLKFIHGHGCEACASGEFCDECLDLSKKTFECNEHEARQRLQMITPPLSVEEMIDNDSLEATEYDGELQILELISHDEMRCAIKSVLGSLSERERYVIKRRYGFAGDLATLEEMGQELGVTRERVRQIEVRAIKKMKHPNREKALKGFY